jgi:hypothetical protein
MSVEQIAPTEPNPEDVIKRMFALIQDAALNGHAVMMCVGRERDGEHSFENARINLESYATAVSMLGRLLHMITAGTGVRLDKVIEHLRTIHADFDKSIRESK